MPSEPTNTSWSDALAHYESLQGPEWSHIRAFRELVAELGCLPEAAGLTAITSHDTLMISPYTKYPDWFEGRHVRALPLSDGQVRVYRFPARFDQHPAEAWTLPLDEARQKIIDLLADL